MMCYAWYFDIIITCLIKQTLSNSSSKGDPKRLSTIDMGF